MTHTKHSSGQGMIEYGLIIALVAEVVIAPLVLLGPAINSLLHQHILINL
ncbi:MAG: Flp family type IVb pilin [Ktedonobacterales bacterium]